ncbi:hypothetical protein R2255_004317 [Cronobacter dublinensis]|uniref:hypothetical protein n=1 Tax=Cronobacter dublinensis TaxID=413497 RepID=UPI0027398434|nr:hypothetical protein [Cronobacter dublinensis]ELQ6127255.1 hypothetical protein [Cronobacter dublinensis]
MSFRILVLVFLYCLSFLAAAKTNFIVGCFSSNGINLKYVEINDENALLGYVLYEKSSEFIPLAFVGKSEITFDDRPSEFTVTWSEVVSGKINGIYIVSTQGARFDNFYYKGKNNKIVQFKENIEAYSSDGKDCKWTKKSKDS